VVRQRIQEDAKRYKLVECAYDPWNATETALALQAAGVAMVEIPQTIRHLNEPTKALIQMVKAHEIQHGGNPFLKWCASNLEVKSDPNGNIRPVKPDYRKTARIDPIVATIMALARARARTQQQTVSVYETRGLLTL